MENKIKRALGENARASSKENTSECRKENPSYRIMDSQSVKTATSEDERGIAEKTKGRKRHIVTKALLLTIFKIEPL